MAKLKQLSADLIEEAKNSYFDFAKNRDIMKALAEALTKYKALLSFELKESGLLEALRMYLTMSPKHVEFYMAEKQKAKGEEYKRSEEL